METGRIFTIKSEVEFNSLALEVFRFQYRHNPVYQEFCNYLERTDTSVNEPAEIPFIPIEFFKTKKLVVEGQKPRAIFTSSGTTGSALSKHYVPDLSIYEQSYTSCFEHFYGPLEGFCILALLPSYLEREGSSLIYMVNDLIQKGGCPDSGFYLTKKEELIEKILRMEAKGRKTILLGVSFALLDMVTEYPNNLGNTIIMETGGMKGRKKEMIREEMHVILKRGFEADKIHSEYGMTELLSQAYSKGDGIFKTPPWMKVAVRDTEDPMSTQASGKTGGINIIDLANVYSCSFIATQDLGKVWEDGSFEILGRFDHSDIRGCNLMAI